MTQFYLQNLMCLHFLSICESLCEMEVKPLTDRVKEDK